MACQSEPQGEEKKKLLCQVYDKQLFLSDVVNLIPSSQSASDSLLFLRAYVDRWIRQELLLRQATAQLEDPQEMEDMVDRYRESLILLQYEQELMASLDPDITEEEMKAYYQEHIDDYALSQDIAKLILYAPNVMDKSSEERWREALELDDHRLLEIGEDSLGYSFVDTSVWLTSDEVETLIPLRSRKRHLLQSGESKYKDVFIYVYDLRQKGEPAPLSYVSENIKRSILNNRRKKILSEKRNELYEIELNKRNVQNYVQ